MTNDVTWIVGNPPRRTGRLFDRLAQLQKRPNMWAEVSNYATAKSASNVKYALSSGKLITPDGRYEFSVHGVTVFGRFLGADPPSAEANGGAEGTRGGCHA